MSEQRCKRLSENISTYIPTYLWPWLQRGSRRDKNRRSRRKDEKLYKRHRRKAHTCSASNDYTTKEVSQKKFVRFMTQWKCDIVHGIVNFAQWNNTQKRTLLFRSIYNFFIKFKISDKWISKWAREREKKIFIYHELYWTKFK